MIVVDDAPIALVDVDQWEAADYPFNRFVQDTFLHVGGKPIPDWSDATGPVVTIVDIYRHAALMVAFIAVVALAINLVWWHS